MTKICLGCGEEKPLSEFHKRNASPDGLASRCKVCRRAEQREIYRKNPDYKYQRNKESKAAKQQLVFDYLKAHPCCDCGESDPVVLEFDHVRGEKIAGVLDMARERRADSVIMEEIAKCEVVCANCHRRRTFTRCNSYRTR